MLTVNVSKIKRSVMPNNTFRCVNRGERGGGGGSPLPFYKIKEKESVLIWRKSALIVVIYGVISENRVIFA